MLFSQRKGFKPIKTVMQLDSIDIDLKNSLWNIFDIHVWRQIESDFRTNAINKTNKLPLLIELLWTDYFKRPVDEIMEVYVSSVRNEIREHFFGCKWFEVYDFIEFIANHHYGLIQEFNFTLKREVSGYRFVGDKITQITSEEEIAEIEQALDTSSTPISIHLKTALDMLSDRKSPDYRNSIKESISAVEAVCKLIANKDKATLDEALKTIASKVDLHPALQIAFSKLYGYTNDAGGIRHSLLEETDLNFEDAKFMLVSCSAFVNYLVSKAGKTGIEGF